MTSIPITALDLLAAMRFTAWALALATAIMLWHVRAGCDMTRPLREQINWLDRHMGMVVTGLALFFSGFAAHQLWWWLAEIGGRRGGGDVFHWFLLRSPWTVVCYVVMFVGVGLMFAGFLARFAGRAWPAAVLAIIGALLAMGIRYAIHVP